MSTSPTQQQGSAPAPAKPSNQQQQGQAPASSQQQAGSPVIRDWASI